MEAKAGRSPVAFYCVSNERYFLGAVGMLNSLRLMGHSEPVFLLDCGLTAQQREILSPHVTLVVGPREPGPHMLKTVAPLKHPADTTVLIDVDMIVTRPFTDLLKAASQGKIVAFKNNLEQRFIAEWGKLLDLGPIRRQPYLSSGLVFLGGSPGEEVVRLLDDRQKRVDFDLTYPRRNVPDYPFVLLEQDVLNPILASRVERERIVALDNRLAPEPPFSGLRVLDEATLRCEYEDGAEPYVLHFLGVRKAWYGPAYRDAYSRLLTRLLVGADVAVKVPKGELPLRMRDGVLARAARARHGLGWRVRERLPESMLRQLDALRRR